jgi:hypothetical protein
MKHIQLFPVVYALLVGFSMIGQWTFFFVQKQIPELVTEPLRISFHLAAEGITAFMLIFSGIGVLMKWPITEWLYPLSMGMLLYTAIVSPGYFAHRGQWGLVWMFVGMILLGIVSLLILL